MHYIWHFVLYNNKWIGNTQWTMDNGSYYRTEEECGVFLYMYLSGNTQENQIWTEVQTTLQNFSRFRKVNCLRSWLKISLTFFLLNWMEYISLIPQNAWTFELLKIFKILIMFWLKIIKIFWGIRLIYSN